MFNPDTHAGRPVYLDLEPEVLERLGTRLAVAPNQVVEILAADVRSAVLTDSKKAFEPLLRRHLLWRRTDVRSVPPTLPILAIFSLAAEQMGEAEGISQNNYYARLIHLLGGDASTVTASYRDVAERLWGGLNLWLDRNDGARGLPTAFALGHRHVGLAVSQALVRDADRQHLRSFFMQFDLPPRSVIPPAELEPMIDFWINSAHSGAGAALTRLWRIATNRSVVCEIAATELSEWTGAINEAVSGRRIEQRARLVLMRAPGLRPRVHISVVVPDRGDQATASVTSDIASAAVPVPLEPFREGLALLGENDTFSPEDLLEGLLTLTIEGVGNIRRTPRRVVVLKHDDLSDSWIESVRVLLGDSLRLLVHHDRLDDVRRALGEMARPGWSERSEIDGLPAGWTELSEVEIFGRPTTPIYSSSDLVALIPATSRQLQLAGGIKVPGRVRNRWHVGRAPELRAVSDGASGFSIHLLDLGASADEIGGEVELECWNSDESNSVVADLSGYELAIGDYALVMKEDGSRDASQRLTFSLRSSAMPDLESQRLAAPFEHDWDAALAVIGADGRGSRTPATRRDGLAPLDERPWWRFVLRQERAATVGLTRPPETSCYYTGKHRERVETPLMDARGKPLTPTTIGRCVECGAERVYSTDYWKLRRAKERADEAAANVIKHRSAPRPPIHTVEDDRGTWDIALDLLVYFGGGDFDLLRKIASEVAEGSGFALQFARTLEGLGHISVQRSLDTLAPSIWHVDPRRLVSRGELTALLGAWTATEVDRVKLSGARELLDDSGEVPAIRHYEGISEEALDGIDVAVARPSADLLPRAASLTAVLPGLRRVGPPLTLNLERFDPRSASWLPTIDASSRGAYRTVGRTRKYVLRTDEDIEKGTSALIDAYTAKHVAAVMLSGKALASYNPQTRELLCPVGANLPVLYERAIVMQTQRPPFLRSGYLVYADVDPVIAARIGYLLTH